MAELTFKSLVLDVDGTMTDGGLYLDDNAVQTKRFDVTDGAGIKFFQQAGGEVAFLTGRTSRAVEHRAAELGVGFVLQGISDKAAGLSDLCRRMGVPARQVAYMGDDLADLPAMRLAGFAIAPANAAEPVRAAARLVTRAPGGHGAVREAVERLLADAGLWEQVLARYGVAEHGEGR